MRSVRRTGFIELRCLYTSQDLGTSRWQLKIEGYHQLPVYPQGARNGTNWPGAGLGRPDRPASGAEEAADPVFRASIQRSCRVGPGNLGRHRLRVAVEFRDDPVAALLLFLLALLSKLGEAQGAVLLLLGRHRRRSLCRSHRISFRFDTFQKSLLLPMREHAPR
jgi:hypothetical protein